MTELLSFLAVAAVVIVTPGQDTALTIQNTLAGGRRAGIATAFGVTSGQLVWAFATSVGLAAVLVASESVFLALKLAGAAYLVYLGAVAIGHALVGHRRTAAADLRTELPRAAAFRHGLVSNLGNPKMVVFFTSMLPQFASGTSFVDLFTLGLVFGVLTLVWLSGYALAVDRASRVLRHPTVRRALDAITGVVLVALGLRLATERR
jgi:threonine/homoserine/homoserine lactone efflux protein